MEQRPNGVLNSLYRHKCLNLTARRYTEMSECVFQAGVMSCYEGNFSNGIWHISNFIQHAWDLAKPEGIEEERALMFIAGTAYGDRAQKMGFDIGLMKIGEKLGIDLDKDNGIKKETIFAEAKAMWSPNAKKVEMEILDLEAKGKQEVIGKLPDPKSN